MEPTFKLSAAADKATRYRQFLSQFVPLVKGEKERVGVLANASAALKEAFGFFWVGFYFVDGEQLVLGPFQGSVACYRIPKGKGVCGTAWAQEQTLVVPDVNQFPGHIACCSLSRSEIVVPLTARGRVMAVLDIDSDRLAAFDNVDKEYLEQVARVLADELF